MAGNHGTLLSSRALTALMNVLWSLRLGVLNHRYIEAYVKYVIFTFYVKNTRELIFEMSMCAFHPRDPDLISWHGSETSVFFEHYLNSLNAGGDLCMFP